jgi:hypothetical protein
MQLRVEMKRRVLWEMRHKSWRFQQLFETAAVKLSLGKF